MDTMEPKPNDPAKRDRIRSAIRFGASVLLFALAFTVFLVVLRARREGKVPTFFGYSFSVVVTGSMEPDIRVGELLIVRETPMERICEGDDVLFISQSGPIEGEAIVHRVIEVGTDGEGIYFRTQGVNNGNVPDNDRVHRSNYVGKAVGHSVFWGKIFGFLSDLRVLMMIAVLVIAVPFVVRQVIRIVRLAKSDE